MNLVQINERLKDLPMQVLQQYANGMNPEVPPYLALGELQRREISQKQAATAQGGQQGPQPSVKEQVEQKAGLMALQQMQQQQAAQQMQQPRGPMPAPAGVPQPEAQPEAMARGGLAAVPVRRDMFEYAGGGIIAFQSGGKLPRIQDEVPISDEERERLYNELITRIVGEEARNPPVRRQPMEITESDTMTIPGMESSNLMARALAEARGPQPDNRALLNQIDARDARRNAMLEREAAKSAARPKYETPYDRMNRQNREPAPEARVINLPKGTSSQEAELVRMQNPDAKVVVEGQGDVLKSLAGKFQSGVESAKKGLLDAFTYSSDVEAAKDRQRPQASYSNEGRSAPVSAQAPYSNEGRRPPVGLPAALAKAAPGARPAPPTTGPSPVAGAPAPAATGAPRLVAPAAGAPAGIAAALPQAQQGNINPYEARLNQVAMKEPVAPTTQDAINRVNELSPASMKEAALQKRNQEMRDRATSYKEQFEKSRPSGLDDLIRVWGQAAQYKGGTGLAPAYTANQQQKRAEELAMTRQYNELMNLADTKELEGGKELFKARTGAFDTAQQLFGKEKDSVVKATASLYETTQSRINNELKMLSDKEIKMLEIDQRERERKSLNARDPNAKVAEYVGLKAKARELREKGGAENIKEADRLMAQAADIMEYKGGSGTAGVGAVRNAISERRLEMAGLEKIMKDEAMIYSDEEKREAAKEYRRLALLNSKESGGSPAGEVDKTNPLLK